MNNQSVYAILMISFITQGPRNCIGNRYAMLSAKIEVLRFIKAYKFTTSMKEKDIKMTISFTGKLSKKHMVSIEKRK